VILPKTIDECLAVAKRAEVRYGAVASTHEALGVLAEEMYELTASIRANALESVRHEALDVAAVALRLADACRDNEGFAARSKK
jgi:NTP pyrophosphatase (non-canonical NTP hydrolase)